MNKYYNKQPKPVLHNQFSNDEILQKYINHFLSKEVLEEIHLDLVKFGNKVANIYPKYAEELERYKPILEKYDAWGNEINELHTSHAWKYFHDECCTEGLVSIAYKYHNKNYARTYQFIKLYLFAASSGLYSCPLSMTDGAVFLIKELEKKNSNLVSETMKKSCEYILTDDPKKFWTSGQWMTEILGGSDVRASTQTIARQLENNKYALYGLKWFTSAIDADITFTLAKIENKEGKIDDYPTLFFVKVRDEEGILNNINPTRLKDKMGTRQLPTAELTLEGTIAEIASEPKRGIKYIMNLANITRLHNITSSVAFMRRIIALVEDYSHKRKVFNYELSKQPLHIIAFSRMKAIFEGNFLLLFQLVKMQNKLELNPNYKNKDIFRMLLPMGKAFAGRSSEEVCLEGIQCFGGVGYMENSHIPVILRDTIVTSIWEGTINVLSFDFIKVKKAISETYQSSLDKIGRRLNLITNEQIKKDFSQLFESFRNTKIKNEINVARNLLFLIGSFYIVSLIAKYSRDQYSDILLKMWFDKTSQHLNSFNLINNSDVEKLRNYSFNRAKAKF